MTNTTMVAIPLDAQNVREGHKRIVRVSVMGKEAMFIRLMMHELLITTYNCITAVGLIHPKLEDVSTTSQLGSYTGMGKLSVAR
jgi:hypothetical protein